MMSQRKHHKRMHSEEAVSPTLWQQKKNMFSSFLSRYFWFWVSVFKIFGSGSVSLVPAADKHRSILKPPFQNSSRRPITDLRLHQTAKLQNSPKHRKHVWKSAAVPAALTAGSTDSSHQSLFERRETPFHFTDWTQVCKRNKSCFTVLYFLCIYYFTPEKQKVKLLKFQVCFNNPQKPTCRASSLRLHSAVCSSLIIIISLCSKYSAQIFYRFHCDSCRNAWSLPLFCVSTVLKTALQRCAGGG